MYLLWLFMVQYSIFLWKYISRWYSSRFYEKLMFWNIKENLEKYVTEVLIYLIIIYWLQYHCKSKSCFLLKCICWFVCTIIFYVSSSLVSSNAYPYLPNKYLFWVISLKWRLQNFKEISVISQNEKMLISLEYLWFYISFSNVHFHSLSSTFHVKDMLSYCISSA